MANFNLTSATTTPQTLGGNETGVLLDASASLSVGTGDAISSTAGSNYLQINGTVLAHTDANANAVDHTGDSLYVFVGPTGLVNSLQDDAFDIRGTGTFDLVNNGAIQAFEDGIDMRGSDGFVASHILNTGTISAMNSGISLDGGQAPQFVVNSGIITARGWAIFSNWNVGTGPTFLNNTGRVSGAEGAYFA